MASPDIRMVAWLKALGYDAHLTPPTNKKRFVTCQGLGGTPRDTLAHPSYSVQVYGKVAEDVASDAWQIMRSLRFTQPPYGIGHVAIEGTPYPLADPDRVGLTCYRMTVTLTCQM